MLRQNRDTNNIRLERCKIAFQFTLMVVASIICGICISRMLSDTFISTATNKICQHFFTVKVPRAFFEYFVDYLKISAFDIALITLILIFSFSFINYVISDLILVFAGIRLGFFARLIATSGITFADKVAFYIFKPITMAMLFAFSLLMALHSLEIRRFSSNGRLIKNRKKLYSMLICSITFIGLILISNGLYCLCIYF